MPVDQSRRTALLVTYGGNRWLKSTIDILVDGKKIGDHMEDHVSPDQEKPFVNVRYVIPGELLAGKNKLTVRFQATEGNVIGGIFCVRTGRADQAP